MVYKKFKMGFEGNGFLLVVLVWVDNIILSVINIMLLVNIKCNNCLGIKFVVKLLINVLSLILVII